MKKTVLSLSILTAWAFLACDKKSPEPPTPDSDVTTSKDAIKSYEVMNDVFLAVALTRDTYTATPFFGNTGISIGKDTVAKVDTLKFNNAPGTDGSIRTGTIIIKYSTSMYGAKYIRQPGFQCSVELYGYTVNTTTISAASITISNTTPVGFNPNTTNISWTASYNNFTTNDGSRSVVVTATHTVKLLNTSDPLVYNNTGNLPIQWNNATISVSGNGNGSNDKGSFEVTFNEPDKNFLYRDMSGCAPEGFLKPGKHPFTKGLIYLIPNGKNTQTVNLGEGTCDYNVTVTIDGITYQTDVL